MTQALFESQPQLRDPAWRLALPALLGLILALLWLYRDTGLAMVGVWQRSDTFAHAFIVPPIALWLIWRRRASLAAMSPRASLWFGLPLLLAGFAWFLGELVAVNALAQAGLVFMLIACVPLVLGRQVAGAMAFPLAFLLFCVPVGEFLMPTLMDSTADFTVLALRMSGIPVYREGLQFVIPSGNWSVVEACSGLRYLIASVMVGTLFAYLSYKSLKRRLAFIVFATVLPIVANWLRAYLIVMLGHHSGNQLAVGADHLVYGWVFFGIVMFAMFMIGARWADSEVEMAPAASVSRPSGSMALPTWSSAAAALLLVLLPQLSLEHLQSSTPHLAAPALKPPTTHAWQAKFDLVADWQPVFANPAAVVHQAYQTGGQTVGLHLAYYRQQNFESKLVSSSNELVRADDSRWAKVGTASRQITVGDESLKLRSTELRAQGAGSPVSRLQVWQFYWVGGLLTSSPVKAKLLTAWQQLRGQGDDAASVIVYAPSTTENADASQEALTRFLTDNWLAINAALKSAASRTSSPNN